jgi:hypothetical protein
MSILTNAAPLNHSRYDPLNLVSHFVYHSCTFCVPKTGVGTQQLMSSCSRK